MADQVLVVDLGGTNMRAAVVDAHGEIRLRRSQPTPREDLLCTELGVPVALANDADLATVGEAFFGAGRGAEDVVYVTVSTGIGAGVVLGDRLVRGRRSLAELGHTIVDLHALADGRPATVEDLGSGTALGRLGAARGLSSSGAALSALVRDGDVDAIEVRTAELGDDAGLVGAAGWSRVTASPSTSGARS